MYANPALDASLKLDAALAYAGRGLPVLACEPMSKKPLIVGGRHLSVYDATTNLETIRRWWTQCPDANVAIAGGNGLLIVDADTYKNSDAIRQLEELIGEPLPPTWTETTPRTGLRMLYTVPLLGPDGEPTNYHGRNVCDDDAVELRYSGQYALVWPSYVVDPEKGIDGGYVRTSATNEVLPAPDGMVRVLSPSTGVVELPDAAPLPDNAYFAAFYEDAVTETPVVGKRNDRTHWFMSRCAELGLTVGQIRTAVYQYPPALAKNSEKPGWLKADLIRWVRDEMPKFSEPAVETNSVPVKYDFASEILDRAKLASLPTIEYLVEDTFGRHSIVLVSGRRSTFKSYLVIDWSCCLATGTDWLDRKVKSGRVLYVVGEGAYGLHSRIRAWEIANGVKVPDDQLVVLPRALKLFRNKQELGEFCDYITREGFTLVVFDTLRRMSNGAVENSNNEMGEIIDAIENVKRATKDGSVIVAAHTDGADTKTRGGTSIEDDVDVVYYSKVDDGIMTLKRAKNKYGPEADVINLRPASIDTDVVIDGKNVVDTVLRPVPFSSLGKVSAQIDREHALFRQLCDVVEKAPNHELGFLGTKELAGTITGTGIKIRGTVKLAAIGKLVQDGWLTKRKHGTSDLYNVSEKYRQERPWGQP